ncbi:MAG: NosD domain-containing protein [Candidatus Thorarchaeota archaeon]
MYERKAVLYVSLFVAVLLFSGIAAINCNQDYILAESPRIQSVAVFKDAQVVSDPIYIDNNADFRALGFQGEGTDEEPYIIENLVIETSITNLIHIQDTTAYFEIHDCDLNGVTKGHYGIYLLNVINAKVIDNVIQNCLTGIFLDYSDDNHLETNLCDWNGYSGIYLRTSSGNILVQNTCSHNAIEGISITEESNYNTLEMNSVSDNRYFGISVDDSAFNQLTGNGVKDCPTGFGLWHSQNNYLSGNTYELNSQDPSVREIIGFHLTYCSNSYLSRNQGTVSISVTSSEVIFIAGFDLEDCTYATTVDNTIDIAANVKGQGFSHAYGFLCQRCDDNELSANSVSVKFQGDMAAHYYGMNLYYSHRNTLSRNDISISADNPPFNFYGNCIHLVECEESIVSGNSVAHGGTGHVYGIHLYWSDNSEIYDNTVTECEQGIGLVDCVGNIVSGNTVDGCSSWGINIVRCEHLTVTDNMVMHSSTGIRLVNTGHSTISDNIVIDCSVGISMSESSFNQLFHNRVEECPTGFHLAYGQNNYLSGNTFELLVYDPEATIFGFHISSCPSTVLSENNVNIAISVPSGITRDIIIPGFYIQDCSYATITANTIDIAVSFFGFGSCNPYGFILLGCYDNELMENSISLVFQGNVYGYYLGMHLEWSDRNTIYGNDISIFADDPPSDFEGFCIRLVECEDNTLFENNVLIDATGHIVSGIYLHDSDSNSVYDNTVAGGQTGISLLNCEENIVSGNTVDGCSVGSINLVDCTYTTITDNIVMHSIVGIRLMYSDYSTITDNTIWECDWGMYLDWSSHNLIFHNNFIDNVVQAVDLHSEYGNYWYHPELLEGNYWSDYPGIDDGSGTGKHAIAGDLIGDTEIPWPGEGFDYYPFVAPLNIEELIEHLIGKVQELVDCGVLNDGTGQSLVTKLEVALTKINQEKYTAALQAIGSFICQVNAFENAGILTNDEAQYLINLANLVTELILQSIAQS